MVTTVSSETPSDIGLGTYRMRVDNAEHRAAVTAALTAGCRVFDTASNYGDGAAEELLGRMVSPQQNPDVAIWTKGGYVAPGLQRELAAREIDAVAPLTADAGYSLSPAVLRTSLLLSLQRLGRTSVGTYFIHNPENLLRFETTAVALEKLAAAFACCGQLVSEGLAESYGVSSSRLTIDPAETRDSFHLEDVLGAAKSAGSVALLRMLQMPCNLLERSVLRRVRQRDGTTASLVEAAKCRGLLLVAHRPINAIYNGSVIRLSDSVGTGDGVLQRGHAAFELLRAGVAQELLRQGSDHRVFDFPVMQFLRDAWDQLPDPDFIDQVFARRVEPFVEILFDARAHEPASRAVAELREAAVKLARHRLTENSAALRAELEAAGHIDARDHRGLAEVATDYVLRSGFDCVLVGMRNPDYVRALAGAIRGSNAIAAPGAPRRPSEGSR
jgi:aryl-alcohol dehydrogenase-like predicted oxidoreductase